MALATKHKASPVGAAAISELDRRIAELEAEEQALLAEQIALEQAAVIPHSPGSMPQAQRALDAARMLDGAIAATDTKVPAEIRLHQIIERRATIKTAVDIGRQRSFRLRIAASAEIAGDLHQAWAENLQQVETRLIELEHLAAERKRLISEWNARTGGVPHRFPFAPQADRASWGAVDDAGYQFREVMRRYGVKAQ